MGLQSALPHEEPLGASHSAADVACGIDRAGTGKPTSTRRVIFIRPTEKLSILAHLHSSNLRYSEGAHDGKQPASCRPVHSGTLAMCLWSHRHLATPTLNDVHRPAMHWVLRPSASV